MLIVNDEQRKCDLDEEVLVFTIEVARYIDVEGKKLAQVRVKN